MEKPGVEKTTVVDASENLGAGELDGEDAATEASSEGGYESVISGVDAMQVRRMGTQYAFQAARWAHKWLVKDDKWWCEGDAMKEAVEVGDEVFVKWHLENCKTNDSRWLMPLAASHGHVGILNLLLERGLSFDTNVVNSSTEVAAEHGQIAVLNWFHENVRLGWSADVLNKAAQRGHLDVLQWLHRNVKDGWCTAVMNTAAEHGHREVVQWLHEHRKEGCTTKAMDMAAKYGHLDVVEWLHTNHSEGCTAEAMDAAAMGGHFEILRWLHVHRNEGCTTMAMTGAAKSGHLDIVKWLHEHRAEGCTTNAMDGATKNGHLHVMKWLHENRMEGCTDYAMNDAARKGHLELVKWLHANRLEGCSREAMDVAAENGHSEVVEWLHEHRTEGCTAYAMDRAAANGHLKLVQWLHANRTEGCSAYAMNEAAKNGHWEGVEWLQENQSDDCKEEAKKRSSLYAHNRKLDSESIDRTARDGHWYIVERLLRDQVELCDNSIIEMAIEHRQLHVVEALYDRQEFRSWPRPHHADLLVDLTRSKGVLPRKILQHLTKCRKQRYQSDAEDNPPAAGHDELTLAYSQSIVSQRVAFYQLTAVTKVCACWKLPDVVERIICEFSTSDLSRLCSPSKAAHRGWVYWLLRYSERPSEDIRLLAELGNYDGARLVHDRLKVDGGLFCNDYLRYITMEKGDLEFVKWHIRNCSVHSTEAWVYLAVWIGRDDVIDWMCQNGEGFHVLKMPVMPYSLNASFSTVEARFQFDLMAVEAWMDEQEQRDQNEDSLSELESKCLMQNVMDLAATNGLFTDILNSRWEKKKPIAGCSIGGLYGAIDRGNLGTVRAIYKLQPDLANWPRAEDGDQVLRKLLNLGHKEMLKFFRLDRNMRLDPRTLDEAVFRGDSNQVRMICEYDLLDWTRMTTNAMDVAAVRGDAEILTWLYATASKLHCTSRAMIGAAEEGHLRVVKFLHRHGAECTRLAIDLAARNGHLEVVQYLWEHQDEGCSQYALYWASERGHIGVVQYLASRCVRCDFDRCLAVATKQEHEEVVSFLSSARERIGVQQWSSRYIGRNKSLSNLGGVLRAPNGIVYCELEQRVWSRGLPKDIVSGIPVPPTTMRAANTQRHAKPQLLQNLAETITKINPVQILQALTDMVTEFKYAFHMIDLLEDGCESDKYDTIDFRGRSNVHPSLPGFSSDELTTEVISFGSGSDSILVLN